MHAIAKHINLLLCPLFLLGLASCADDPVYRGSGIDSDAVTFQASVSAAFSASSRAGEKPLYEPLVLTSASGADTLYLHTYESTIVGGRPGQESDSRGMQVTDIDGFETIHKDFTAHAEFTDDGRDYIGWVTTHALSKGSDIWLTPRTEYWPAQEKLSFHAIAPSSERSSLANLVITPGALTFDYTAKHGTADNDAEMQTDLMVATSSCNRAGSVDGRAPLQFHHALSSIKFAVRDVMGGEVENIKIVNVYGSGTCHYEADDNGSNGRFTWSDRTNRRSYSQDFNFKYPDRIVDPTDESADLSIAESMPSKTFMLIPQQISADAEVVITIKYNSTADMQGYTKELRAKILDNNVTEWKAGHEYVYTISTSSDNWVYEFRVYGNHTVSGLTALPAGFTNGAHANVTDATNYAAEGNAHGSKADGYDVNGNMIYVYSPSDTRHDKYGDDAYFKVVSYRYRANNHSHVEDLPWKADYDVRGEQWREISTGTYEYVTLRDLEKDMNETWITDNAATSFSGTGSHDSTGEIHDLTFFAHHQMTDWPGDKWMDDNDSYGTDDSPWDLSTCGGNTSQWTANCYVVDRPGVYSFPLYYGNAIEDGAENSSSYYYTGTTSGTMSYFKDYNNDNITTGKIPSNLHGSAEIVWADVYNAVSDVKLVGDKIVFHANRGNMQQGNIIIALKKGDGTIVWSWHIWVNEHWLEPGTGVPDALKNPSSCFAYEAAEGSGWRQRGDVLVETEGVSRRMAAYNLGWCDPKNVDYLFRPSTMKFTQYLQDGTTKSKRSASLLVVQDGERVAYKYGNNTYYQWGRKDPMVGFVDHGHNVKRNFGVTQYQLANQRVPLSDGIKYPYIIYCGRRGTKADGITLADPADVDNWSTETLSNLWNNGVGMDSKTSNTVVKTIYDPCPAGYAVPPSSILRFIGKANNGSYDNFSSTNTWPLSYFNGHPGTVKDGNGNDVSDEYTFIVKRTKDGTYDNSEVLWLTSTGQRWYCSGREGVAPAGGNFNPNLVYLWSSTSRTATNSNFEAFCIALGYDTTQGGYCITPYFTARKSMARPVRPVRQRL